MGPAGGAEIVAPPKGVQTAVGVFAIPEGLVTRPREVAPGCLVALGDIDHRESAGARQAGQVESLAAVRCDPLPGLCGHEAGRDHPAGVVFCPELPRAPGAAGASRRAKEEVGGWRWPLTAKVSALTLSCAPSAYRGDLGAMVWGDRRHGQCVCVDLHADQEGARLRPGCLPRGALLWRQQAARVSRQLTRVPSGVNLPPLEVIMSRPLP